jgi:hypothetical protein
MSDSTQTDLTAYAQTIRSVLGVDELEPIDFAQCEHQTDDIERRRALFRYFIPDVFTPGKYDRRADLIDACIYYLEALEGKGQYWESPIIEAWTERNHIARNFRFEDVEVGPYGYEFYHPVWSILGATGNPGLVLPTLIKYLRTFRDRRLKLGINDYSLIFFSIFNAMLPVPIDEKIKQVARLLQEEIQGPVLNGFDLWSLIKLRYPKTTQGDSQVIGCSQDYAKWLAAEFNKVGCHVIINFERSVFGLARYILQFRFPHHYELNIRGGTAVQVFLTGGRDYLQEITLNLPMEDLDWRNLFTQVHPDSQIYRQTMCRNQMPSPSLLTYFDVATQDWNIPWDSSVREWEAILQGERDSTPFDPDWGFLMPEADLIRIKALLEENPLYLNSELQTKTKLPLTRVKELRETLEQETLVGRIIWIPHYDLSVYCIIDVPGTETWKAKLLMRIAQLFPSSNLSILENVRTSAKSLRAGYFHRPQHINTFCRLFYKTFSGKFKFSIHQMFFRPKFGMPLPPFDPKTGTWLNDLANYTIRPMPFAKLQRDRGG